MSYCSLTLNEILRDPVGFGGFDRDIVCEAADDRGEEMGGGTRGLEMDGPRRDEGCRELPLLSCYCTKWRARNGRSSADRRVRTGCLGAPDAEANHRWRCRLVRPGCRCEEQSKLACALSRTGGLELREEGGVGIVEGASRLAASMRRKELPEEPQQTAAVRNSL